MIRSKKFLAIKSAIRLREKAFVIASEWDKRGDPDRSQKRIYIILDCFAIARNDEVISTAPQSRYARQLP